MDVTEMKKVRIYLFLFFFLVVVVVVLFEISRVKKVSILKRIREKSRPLLWLVSVILVKLSLIKCDKSEKHNIHPRKVVTPKTNKT